MDQWDKEFDDIDYSGGEAFFIMDDSQDMIEIRYHDGMLIDVGLDSDNIYNITVLASDDKKDMDAPLCVVKFSDRAMLHDKLQEIIGRFREGAHENEAEEENEIRIAELIEKYGSDFLHAPKEEIRTLINEELEANNGDDPEYLRLLCAILFCVGDKEDAHLIKKVKFSGSMDILDAIDKDWISCLETGGGNDECERTREEIVSDIMFHYFYYDDKIGWE